jgi:hypothetical protein
MHPGGAQRRAWPARRYAELINAEAEKLGLARGGALKDW